MSCNHEGKCSYYMMAALDRAGRCIDIVTMIIAKSPAYSQTPVYAVYYPRPSVELHDMDTLHIVSHCWNCLHGIT